MSNEAGHKGPDLHGLDVKIRDIRLVRASPPFTHPEKLYPIPLLSTYNGPSYLLHAVDTLYRLGIPHTNISLVPIIGYWSGPEVEPYYSQSQLGGLPSIEPELFRGRLGINIREKSRLARFLPLVVLGLTTPDQVRTWRAQNMSASQGYQQIYAPGHPVTGGEPLLATDVREWATDWTNSETPTERLTRQLCLLYPELRDTGITQEIASGYMLTTDLIRRGRWNEQHDIYMRQVKPDRSTDRSIESPQRTALTLVERFFTETMLILATADMMGGFEYAMRAEPYERDIEVTVTPRSDVREVVRWLHTYPHHPLPQSPTATVAREMAPELRKEWDDYFALRPDHDNIFKTAELHWTEEDPAIIALFGDIRSQAAAGREERFSSREMLALALKYLPDYLPCYPGQFAVTGGVNLEGILLGLMEYWMAEGENRQFLGLTQEDWALFNMGEQAILWGLVMQRNKILDQCHLFQTAVRLLVGTRIESHLERYRLHPVRLGKSLAQLGRSLSLDGTCALHAPEMRVSIPLDRERDANATVITRKLVLIARLFLPLHIPMQMLWKVDRPMLGRTTYLTRKGGRQSPATRLASSLK